MSAIKIGIVTFMVIACAIYAIWGITIVLSKKKNERVNPLGILLCALSATNIILLCELI